jgi:hypothetical protein
MSALPLSLGQVPRPLGERVLDVVTRATGIVGQRGTGKTSTGVVLVEEASACGAQFAVIDPTGAWWGLRSSSDGEGEGLPVVVFGGDHADVPLEEAHGPLITDLVVGEGYNPVLDLSLLTKAAQVRFVAEFLETLYHRNREALMLVIDEAHRFAPQSLQTYEKGGPAAQCLGAVSDVVTLGRRKGLGGVVISQRPAKINKDVFEQVEVVVAHRLMGPNDRKQIAGWLAEADEEAADLAKSALEDLRKLPNGEALVYAPNLAGETIYGRYRIRPKQTFDSSATPEIGVTVKEPKARTEVDMAALETRMSDVLEKRKAEDPKLLQRQLRELKKELADAAAAAEFNAGEVARLTEEHEALLDQLASRPSETVELTDLDREVLQSAVAELKDALEPFGAANVMSQTVMHEVGPPRLAPAIAEAIRSRTTRMREDTARPEPARPEPPQTSNGDVKIGKGELKVMDVLREYPEGKTQNEVAFLAGYSATASTVGVILATLRRAGYVEPGQPIRLTEAGLAAAGGLVDLIELYPNVPSHAELCEATGYSPSASTMGVILSKLRKLGLVQRGQRAVNPEFYEAIQ